MRGFKSIEKTDYEYAVIRYLIDMEKMNFSYKYEYTPDQLHDIEVFIRRLVKLEPNYIIQDDSNFSESLIRKFFLDSLRFLKNKNVLKFYQEKNKLVSITNDSTLESDEGLASIDELFSRESKILISLPEDVSLYDGSMIYAHEMGHVPELVVPRDSYLEYQEVLPIFMEYLSALRRYGVLSSKEIFVNERISMDIDHANIMRSKLRQMNRNSQKQRLYARQEFADTYKYLQSTDFVLQLIEIMDKDRAKIGSEIEDIIEGKSLIETATDLSIDTDGCKKVLKYYQQYGKRRK